MKRSVLVSLALSLLLAGAVAPGALAADPGAVESGAPGLPAPTPTPMPTDDGTPPDGEISVDPTFITATASDAVLGATGRPDVTLPPTHATGTPTGPGGVTLQALILVLAAVSTLILLAGRVARVRRR